MPETPTEIQAVQYRDGAIVLLDQTQLPGVETYVDCASVDAIVDAVVRLVVRGAPALGAVGGYGVAAAMAQGEREGWSLERLHAEVTRIRDARPTAVNLAWGVDRVRPHMAGGIAAVVTEGD